MAIKYLEAEKLRLETRKKLTATPENWMQFLRTASNTYKYSYSSVDDCRTVSERNSRCTFRCVV